MKKTSIIIIFALLLTIFSLASVSAVTVNSSVSFTAAGVNYTTTQPISPSSITTNSSDLYLEGVPYCDTVYTSYFTTTRVCAEDAKTLQETLEEIEEDAKNKNAIIFAGFSLLALAILIAAGYMIFQAMQGEADSTTLMLLVVAGIGLTIVIIAGYYILSLVASNIA